MCNVEELWQTLVFDLFVSERNLLKKSFVTFQNLFFREYSYVKKITGCKNIVFNREGAVWDVFLEKQKNVFFA